MALISRPIIVDGIKWGTVYTLEHKGDDFPAHVHTDADIHITILAFGSVECYGRTAIEGKILTAAPGGMIVNWKAGEAHGFRALEDGTTLVNLLKNRGG